MSDQTTPPGNGDDSKPKPPPGISEVTHMPARIPIYDIVRDMRQQFLDAKVAATVEDLLVIVCPMVAAEVYAWGWRVRHPDVRAYAYTRHTTGMGWAQYALHDVIGTVHGYCTTVSGLQREGYVNLLPYTHIPEWKRQAEAFHSTRCRGGR